jgi:hypothetical protein
LPHFTRPRQAIFFAETVSELVCEGYGQRLPQDVLDAVAQVGEAATIAIVIYTIL